jgi:AcrR family transcriptional regulator
VGNRERIVEASLELFNERGARSVTTNHIAAHLSISPGNLYYHFGNKEEIIRALFPQFSEAVYATIPVPEEGEITAEDIGRYHLAGIETLWRYRFVFRDLNELLDRDPILAEAFRGIQLWLRGQFESLFERLIEQGQMRRPNPPEDLSRIATNSFILWSSWIRFLTSSRAKLDLDPVDVVDGALQSFLTFAPYLDPGFAQEVRAVFDERARRCPQGDS